MKRHIESVATVDFNNDFYRVMVMSQGMLQYAEPSSTPLYLPPEVDDETLGAGLRAALTASKRVSVEDFQRIFASGVVQKLGKENEQYAMLQYGYKTRRALYKNMLFCLISVFEGLIEIKSTHHKSIEIYTGISDDGPEIIRLPVTVSDAELGAALREGFKRCTSAVG